MAIELRSQFSDDIAVLYCRGQLNANESGRTFRARVADLLQQSPRVIVDLSQVDYIDSSSLGILVGLYSTARMARSTLKYRNLVASVDYRQSFTVSASDASAEESTPPLISVGKLAS